MKRALPVLAWLTSLALPVFLIMTAIRLLFTPFFVEWEYQRPNFPPDRYGFTTADRIKWAGVSLEYLGNDAGIDFLGNQKLDDGSPLYNERELSHMLDVKIVLKSMVLAWTILLTLFAVEALAGWRWGKLAAFWQAVSRGGWLTIGFVITILLAVAISFSWLFTMFHRLFFSGDSWLFAYSDNLIRLFPMQLWQDAFTWMGGITLAAGALCWVGGRRLSRHFS